MGNAGSTAKRGRKPKYAGQPEEAVDPDAQNSASAKSAMQIGQALWDPNKTPWPTDVQDLGPLINADTVQTDQDQQEKVKQPSPIGKRAVLYVKFTSSKASAWLDKVQKEKIAPNAAQLLYLRHVIDRCAVEAREERENDRSESRSEPARISLIAPPGTGKSQCILWQCRFFEEVLGWTMGVQFQTVAAQNTMAANVGGNTIPEARASGQSFCR